jgi:riboflavin kinase / FMN adenylyltransferase
MELIRGTSSLRDLHRGCVVTIGTFDGIHVGHQALIRRAVQRGAQLGRAAMLLTFEPTPREYLAPDTAPARLTTLRERCRALARLAGSGAGVDAMCVLRFDDRLRRLSGGEFAHLLARDLRASEVVVGHDFRFGHGAAGSAQALREAGPGLGFQVEVVDPIVLGGERVSSSGVRAALAAGDFARAGAWLGRPYSMLGRVVAGERLGRRLGFPTANIRPGRKRMALGGIFAVRVHGAGLEARPGVASLGTRPTVNGVEPLLEAHVFDFDGDLYGRELEVEFVAKLRDEQRFASLDALVAQMHRDAQAARHVLE